jgi:hypothetical protein
MKVIKAMTTTAMTRMTWMTWMTMMLGTLALAACALEQAPESSTEQSLLSCPDWACGQNGPLLNGHYFHELAESKAPNLEGFSLGVLVKNGLSYAASVTGMQLRGSSRLHGTLAGSQLVGAYFEISHDSGKRYHVLINGTSTMQIYSGPMTGATIPQYILEWIEVTPGAPPDHYHNLCSNPPTGAYRQETLFQHGESTLFFEGTRYDAQAKDVLFGDSNWFNLGCAGSALSKLLLTGHTSLTGSASQQEQQTALKLLTADYCGDGKSFTVAGEPLYWKTQNGYMAFAGAPASLEGRWGASGPVCLDDPRLVESDLQAAKDNFPADGNGTPGVLVKMMEHCPTKLPPACSALPGNYDFAGSVAVSGNPPL